jgi:hypothetical protein
MTRAICIGLLAATVFTAGAARADSKTAPPNQITTSERVDLIRGLQSEFVVVRRVFPLGEKGLVLKKGVVSPSDRQVQQMVADHGVAARPGDRGQITNIEIKDHSIVFELNGGPVKKQKWYQRITVVGMGGEVPIAPTDAGVAHGSLLTLEFDKKVPNLTVKEVKDLLAPVFDFNAHSAAEAYIETLPPIVKQAVKEHRVLVGMDRDLVVDSKGRPNQKIREKDEQGKEYEEWIYGQPPQEVTFVRFMGDEVARVETIQVGGDKIVRTEKEVDLAAARAKARADAAAAGAAASAGSAGQPGGATTADTQRPTAPVDPNDPTQKAPTKKPTLRRPGETTSADSSDTPKN